MPFGMMLAARLARGAFADFEGGSSFEGIFSSQKSRKSFDVVRSTLFSDQPADSLDVSKSRFNATKNLAGQDTLLPRSDSDSLFSSKSLSDHSLPGETGTITTKKVDGPNKTFDEKDNDTPKMNDKIESKKSSDNNWKRAMKLISAYYDPTNFDGRTLAVRGIDNGLGQQSNSIDAATTRVIRGDSSTSMNDFTDKPPAQQNSIISDMLIIHLFAKSQQKSQEAEKRESAKIEEFHEEFNKRIHEEAAKLKEHASANANSIRQSESSRDSGTQDHAREKSVNRRWLQ